MGQLTEEILTFDPDSPPPQVCANLRVCFLRDLLIKPRFLSFYAIEGNYSLRPEKRELVSTMGFQFEHEKDHICISKIYTNSQKTYPQHCFESA